MALLVLTLINITIFTDEFELILRTPTSAIVLGGVDQERYQEMPSTSHRALVILLGTALSRELFQMR